MRPPRSGFTLIEVIIAAGLLSIFLIGVFNLYRSGSNVFRSGNWRMVTQKQMQLTLQQIREDLERANNATCFLPTGIASEVLPVYLRRSCTVLGSEPTQLTSITPSQLLLYASITTPNTETSSVAATKAKGTWMGIALYGGTNSLRYVRKSNPDTEPPPSSDNITNYKPSGGVGSTASFTGALSDAIHKLIDNPSFIEGVSSIGFSYQTGERTTVTILLRSTSQIPGQPVTTVEERVTAKLLTGTTVVLFP
ncbi:MAG TPA: prepilin-type N-terminal cleavage/methylation domain-containing protein [Candidatus Ozemobacteraceae bacterium]|nr:prepilin-type N-terminal cleavage/methylation domain-containing protein [Candidatus Ozemobacteraceae bacterium]